jgi:glycosyltransferase involved in cell wall biosynthesis
MKYVGEDFLVIEVREALSQNSIGSALDLVHQFVDQIINDTRATTKVLSSRCCDNLCREISSHVTHEFFDNAQHQFSTVFLLSEIIESGGHIELLKDYISLELFPKPCIIVTNLFSRQNNYLIEKFRVENNIPVFVVAGGDSFARLSETTALLQRISPQKLILLNHHQDSGAIVAALAQFNCQKYFIHHADHQLCLGVTCVEFVHVDLHNMGYWGCSRTEGLKDNKYWPLIVRQNSFNRSKSRFMSNEGLLTCSSGSGRKFEPGKYKFDYFELLPKILLATQGSHVHIGKLTQKQLESLKTNFQKSNINWDRFHHIPWVSSVSNELSILGVDLYISSFPLGGGKTILEAMSVGIPLLVHENYRSRLAGGMDLAYPEAFVWRNEDELFRILKGLSPQLLEKHSGWALSHIESYHTKTALIDAVGSSNAQDIKKIPKLREYSPNLLQTFLEDMDFVDLKIEKKSDEIEEIKTNCSIVQSAAIKLANESQEVPRANGEAIIGLGPQEQLTRGSLHWSIAAQLRWVKKLLNLVGLKKSTCEVALKKAKEFIKLRPYSTAVESDFDEQFYCALYPDILEGGSNPLEHFIRHGKLEGRLGKAPDLDIKGAFEDFNSELETVIVVSHEATLTGAPILAKNIVDDLRSRYNVIVILLDGGPLSDSFYQKGVLRAMANKAKNNELLADIVVSELLRDRHIKFAITNTIESSSILPALAKRGIPTVSLIHEFASSVKNKIGFKKSYFWSEQIVFSSSITYKNLVSELPELKDMPISILAQGKSSTLIKISSEFDSESRARLLSLFQSTNEQCTIVLGIGTIYYRKGVDLFIQCASYLQERSPEKEFIFIWIGKNVDDELGVDYSTYLNDQIQRSTLQNKVLIFDEMADIEFAYRAADVFLLTSRLDPLPNVAIDALCNGVPVLCFEKASGIANILEEEGLGDACVAPFLDVNSMAEKLLKLTESEEILQNTKKKCENLSQARFDMATYVSELERIAGLATSTKMQFLKDVSEIKRSGLFRFDYATANHWKGLSEDEIISAYVRAWRSGIDLRKPMPGFHPGIYKEKHGVLNFGGDPFADFIREGCPSGPWSAEVLTIKSKEIEKVPQEFKVALHIHAFYPQLLNQILKRINANKARPDLYISVPSLEAMHEVESLLSNYEGEVKAIEIAPNQGRDIGPLLTLFGEDLVGGYDVIGHVHTKVSPHADDGVGTTWSNFLLENLLGGDSGAVADQILYAMYKNPNLGLVFPDDPHPVGWDKNLNDGLSLAHRLKLKEPLENNFNFPVGTMFWARSGKIAPLVNLGFTWGDYPQEPLPIDGTFLHAIERILPSICPEMKSLLLNVPNVSR